MREGCPWRKLHQPSACSAGQAGRTWAHLGDTSPSPYWPQYLHSAALVMAESQQPLHVLLTTSSHPTCPRAELPPSPGAALSPRLPRYPGAGQRMPAGPAQHPVTDTTQPEPHVPGGSAKGLPLFLLLSSSPPTPAPLGSPAVATEGLLPGDEALDPLDPRGGYPDQPHQPVSAGTGLAATLGCPGAAGECSSTGRAGRSWWQ